LRASTLASILVPLVPVVSRSLFVLLFSVTLLAAAASLQSGAPRLAEFGPAFRAESRADVYALREDVQMIGAQLKSAPSAILDLWRDACADARVVGAQVSVESRLVARKIAMIVN
jgi:hypothetical protein